MKLELKNLRISQQRVNDLRPVGKPYDLNSSIRYKRPYALEFVKLDVGDWQTFEKVSERSIAMLHHRQFSLSDALIYRTVSLNENDRYKPELTHIFKEHKTDWNSRIVR